jgi:ectoine hydroxylase-related dioxygenase (phytanoyl-CoA dioxygenase family)
LNKKQTAPDYVHPNEVNALGSAGSLLIFNSHIYHSGTLNRSKKTRRSIQCFFVALEFFNNVSGGVDLGDYAGLAPAIRYLLRS